MVWKPLIGFESQYKISNTGQIYSYKRSKICTPKKHTAGYFRHDIYVGGKRKRFFIHRLVAQTFIPNPDNKPCINHKNGIKTDNRVENLEWCTRAENLAHARETGLAYTKLTKEQVKEIRERFEKGETKRGLGRLFDTDPRNIDFIIKKEHWVNV